MGLSPASHSPRETVRGVQFAMLDGTMVVTIVVAHATLQALEWSPPGDYLTRFQKHRSALELIASNKHQRGEIEENGSILIRKGDR
ncbi:MAG TPA: DUF1488 family protein [Hyphomicrobiaceae bacterium]